MPEQDTEILVSAGKGARLQCALDKQAAFSVKGVLPRQVPHPRQSSVIFCEQLLQQDLHRRSVWPLPAFLISCKDEVEECSLCHDLSMMPNYCDYFWSLIHVGLCPDFQDDSGSSSCSCTYGSEFSILQAAFGLFFPRCISLHLSLLKSHRPPLFLLPHSFLWGFSEVL